MNASVELLNSYLNLRLDTVGFSLLVFSVCVCFWRTCARVKASPGSSAATTWLLAAIVIGGVGGAEWITANREDSFGRALATSAETYARELRELGHLGLNAATPANDPAYVAAMQPVEDWRDFSPAKGDLFTFRLGRKQQIRTIVDANRTAPGGGTLSFGSDSLFRVLAGETFFDPQVHIGDRGAWVYAYTPVRTAAGHVEAGLALGSPALEWVRTVAVARAIFLISAALLIAAVLGNARMTALSRVNRARLASENEARPTRPILARG